MILFNNATRGASHGPTASSQVINIVAVMIPDDSSRIEVIDDLFPPGLSIDSSHTVRP